MTSFIQHLQQQGKSKSTIKYYNYYILDFLAFLDIDNTSIDNATAKEVLAYLNHLQIKGQQNKTRYYRLLAIKHFFFFQIDQGIRNDNPVILLKIRGKKRAALYPMLSNLELDNIYTNYPVPQDNHPKALANWFKSFQLARKRNKTILSLLCHQALTTPEIQRLSIHDLQLKKGQIFIHGTRKSNERTLTLHAKQIVELMEYLYTTRNQILTYQHKSSDALFLPTPKSGSKLANKNGTLLIFKGLRNDIRKYRPDFINFKQIRASIITHWIKQHNLRQVQYMAGHKFIISTEAYLVNQVEGLQKDVDNFHPF